MSNDLLCVRKEYALYIDRSVVICAGAVTKVEALRKALGEAEAEEKAVQQQAAHKTLKARGQRSPAGAPGHDEEV